MPGWRKKLDSRADSGDSESIGTDAVKANFARLQYIACTMLGYTKEEYRFMRTIELIDQFAEWCEWNKVDNPSKDEEGVQF
jgi:hypothetical protein